MAMPMRSVWAWYRQSSIARTKPATMATFSPLPTAASSRRPPGAVASPRSIPQARRALLSHDPDRRELDSSSSSDALLMNIFCHPATLVTHGVRLLLGVNAEAEPIFGYRPGVPLRNGRRDCTEIDMMLGDLLIEAKLTEYDFQTAARKLIERYRDIEAVFDIDKLEIVDGTVQSYQLIRGVLAAHALPGLRFCVLCDARRPDLITAWHRTLTTVKLYDLRCRLQLLT
jgi:hypothetical protein